MMLVDACRHLLTIVDGIDNRICVVDTPHPIDHVDHTKQKTKKHKKF